MKNIAILLDNIPSDGGTYQYNLTILDAFYKLPDHLYNKKIFYTNLHWHEKLKNVKYDREFVSISINQKKIFKLIALLDLNKKIRYFILVYLFSSISKSLNNKDLNLIIFPSQDVISLFVKTNKISAIHDLMHRYESHFPEVSQFLQGHYRDILFNSFCKESLAILVDSSVGKDHVYESYNLEKDKIFVLPFIPPSYIVDNFEIKTDFNEVYPELPKEYIIYPAQFWKHKNHQNLLKAIAIVKKNGININLVFTGKKTYEYENLLALIKNLKIEENIKFVNFISEDYLKTIYLNSKGLVMPTFFGPTNIPPLEAVFSGCPVAVSNIYGMPEQLKDAALYFNPNSIEEIANAITILWTDNDIRNELLENGIKLTKNWNQNIFYKKFEMIVDQIFIKNVN